MASKQDVERQAWIARIFAEWERRYRANPKQYMSEAEALLGHTPQKVGELSAAYFVALEREVA
jgi:hypothetical protein